MSAELKQRGADWNGFLAAEKYDVVGRLLKPGQAPRDYTEEETEQDDDSPSPSPTSTGSASRNDSQ